MQITIKNVQSIKEVSFELKGLTVLTGDNDIGKSATYRAIEALFRNTKGDTLIKNGTPEAEVTIGWENNKLVWSKHRKKSSNYIFNGAPENTVIHGYPDFIDKLGFGTINIQKTKLDPHFSGHNTMPFLVFNTDQTLTDFFSEILQFGSLGKALISCNKDIREANLERKVLIKELDRAKTNLEVFKDLDVLEHGEQELKALEKSYINLKNKADLIADYFNLDILLQEGIPDVDCLNPLKDIISNYKKARACQNYLELEEISEPPNYNLNTTLLEYLKASFILKLLEPLLDLDLNIESIDTYLKIQEYLDLDLKSPPELPDLSLELLNYYLLEVDLIMLQDKLVRLEELYQSEKENYHTQLKELGVCPICEKEI